MELADTINLAITIGLGVISIILGIFSIWLSMRFNDSSNSALDSVKSLSHELKSLSEISLTHQKDFSSKMLDSLLDQGKYGTPTSNETYKNLESRFIDKLTELENSLSSTIESELKEKLEANNISQTEIKEILSTIRAETDKLKSGTITAAKNFAIPAKLKSQLKSFIDYPANYLLIEAIAKEKITTADSLAEVTEKYGIPDGWEEAIGNLAENGIVSFSKDHESFSIPSAQERLIMRWINSNQKTINKIRDITRDKNEPTVTEEERAIALDLTF
ncbi:hypothetical protein [Pseudomonas leptonychotis]|uniref:Uncharacterized protein n=1 Tax=Pseudomonas leptonychotis TaxID=2448482 RepID=A0A4V4R7M4_9PSED|nr:hypothetical protein [Pseudomonas leptonychotis]TIH07184.1 hypothetical protein D8779_17725 [Pseudomonas leptonychotis]